MSKTPQWHSLTRITRLIQGITLKLRPLLPLLRHHPTGRVVTSSAWPYLTGISIFLLLTLLPRQNPCRLRWWNSKRGCPSTSWSHGEVDTGSCRRSYSQKSRMMTRKQKKRSKPQFEYTPTSWRYPRTPSSPKKLQLTSCCTLWLATKNSILMTSSSGHFYPAGLRRICKRSYQSKIERPGNNDARLILRRRLNRETTW